MTKHREGEAARPFACDGEDEGVPFRERDGSTNIVLWDSSDAARANEHSGKIARVRDGNTNTARARKFDRALDRLATIENLGVYAKAKMAIELHAPADVIARSPRPPSFVSVSPSVEMLRL